MAECLYHCFYFHNMHWATMSYQKLICFEWSRHSISVLRRFWNVFWLSFWHSCDVLSGILWHIYSSMIFRSLWGILFDILYDIFYLACILTFLHSGILSTFGKNLTKMLTFFPSDPFTLWQGQAGHCRVRQPAIPSCIISPAAVRRARCRCCALCAGLGAGRRVTIWSHHLAGNELVKLSSYDGWWQWTLHREIFFKQRNCRSFHFHFCISFWPWNTKSLLPWLENHSLRTLIWHVCFHFLIDSMFLKFATFRWMNSRKH